MDSKKIILTKSSSKKCQFSDPIYKFQNNPKEYLLKQELRLTPDGRLIVSSAYNQDIYTELSKDNPVAQILASKFYIDVKIGQGGFSRVYKCKCKKTGELRAIKICNEKTYSVKNKKYFKEEMTILRILAQEKHENIVQILDHFSYIDWSFIVMEYCNGGTLIDYLKRHGPISESLGCFWFTHACKAVKFLHLRLKIAHRDIKLENILIHNNIAKLADFTLAKECWDHRNNKPLITSSACGTLEYASPQKLRGRLTEVKYNPFADDMWALGISLFVMFFRKFPFGKGWQVELATQLLLMTDLTHLKQLLDQIPDDLSDLIKKLLCFDEEQRIKIEPVLTHFWILRKKFELFFETEQTAKESRNMPLEKIAPPKIN